MTNVGVQLFSFERSSEVSLLFRGLEMFVEDVATMRMAWLGHRGERKSVSLKMFLNNNAGAAKLNRSSIQSPSRHLRSSWKELGFSELIVNLRVSPDCCLWAPLAAPLSSGNAG